MQTDFEISSSLQHCISRSIEIFLTARSRLLSLSCDSAHCTLTQFKHAKYANILNCATLYIKYNHECVLQCKFNR